MTRNPSVFCAIVAAVCLASCGGATSSGSDSATPAAQLQPPAAPAGTAPAAGLEPSTLKACEIVTPQDAASIAGGRLLNEPPTGYSNCAYVIEVKGQTESYRLAFTGPGSYAAMLAAQTDAEKGERLEGLLDEAFVQPRAMGGGFSVVALRRGDVALEVSGDRRDAAVGIARLAASRVR